MYSQRFFCILHCVPTKSKCVEVERPNVVTWYIFSLWDSYCICTELYWLYSCTGLHNGRFLIRYHMLTSSCSTKENFWQPHIVLPGKENSCVEYTVESSSVLELFGIMLDCVYSWHQAHVLGAKYPCMVKLALLVWPFLILVYLRLFCFLCFSFHPRGWLHAVLGVWQVLALIKFAVPGWSQFRIVNFFFCVCDIDVLSHNIRN